VDEDILRYANNKHVDLIVMGTEGAAGFKETFMGSHAGYLVGHSSVPVLTLKCDRSDLDFKDILLVSDFEKVEEVDLGVVKNLQAAFDAKIHLLRVNTAGHFKAHSTIREHMVEFAELNDLQNVEFHIYGDDTVEKGIVHFSDENGISFVALGTHQRKGFGRLFKHSVSKDLVNHIYQPVLVFPI
jgi:nucleotide-binding universal stress UspA family protein